MQNVIERVLNLLIFLLESPRPVTAEEIRYTVAGYGQESDDAFHRMFERDKDLLRNLGIPIRLDPMDAFEVEFGYTIDPDEYAVTDPGLTEEERVALSLAARMVRLGGSHLGLNALLKLGGMARVVGSEPLGADLGDGAAVLGDLFAAVTERRRVSFEYRGVKRTLEPWGIAHRRGHWYVTGKAKEGERNYRVDRMEKLELSSESRMFERPKGFDTKKLMDVQPWEAGTGDRVEATVRFDAEVAWWAARTLGETEPSGGEPLEATVPVTNRDAFVGWVLSFGEAAEVVAPEELRAEVVARVEAALESVT
jgi:proteasome accessory factor B